MHVPEDYKNNPLYYDITRLDHLSPQPTFQYKWNSLSGRWEPLTFTEITDELIGISGESAETNRILSGISGSVISGLQDIHIGVDLDYDEETHRLLSGISGELTELEVNVDNSETNRILSGISGVLTGSLNDIHIGVDLDHDTETHRLLSGISGSVISGLQDIHVDVEIDSDNETHRLLSGISGSVISGLQDIHVDVEIDSDNETHRLLSGISGSVISGLQDIHVDVEIDSDNETHRLLSGISGSVISGLQDIEIGVNLDHDSETHRLLSGISGSLGVNDDAETHRLLSGISGVLTIGLSGINEGVDLDHDTETHRLLSGLSGSLGNSDDEETHRLLSGISGILNNIHDGVDLDHDTETHRLLSGVSGLLEDLEISGKTEITGDINVVPIKLRTKTVTEKFEEDFILLESIPENQRYGITSGVTYGKDRDIMDDIFGTHFNNARKIDNSPETGHADFLIQAEWMEPDRPRDSIYTFDTDTEYGLRQENQGASLINSYELEDYNNLYKRGLLDHITIFNRSPYPLQFHTADDRRASLSQPVSPKTDDILFLDPDFAVKIKNDEAARVFIKRPHTLSGYSVDYSITYKVPGELEI